LCGIKRRRPVRKQLTRGESKEEERTGSAPGVKDTENIEGEEVEYKEEKGEE
jgi:hypothetical protein